MISSKICEFSFPTVCVSPCRRNILDTLVMKDNNPLIMLRQTARVLRIRKVLLFLFVVVEVQLIYNVVPISAVQKSDSVTHTHTHIYIYLHSFLNILFHSGLSQKTGYSFLCYSRTLFIHSKCNHVLKCRKWGNCPWKAEELGRTHPPPRVTHTESEWAVLPCNIY